MRWLLKPGNAGYDRGAVPLDRVRRWRKAHPGYWRRRSKRQPVPDRPEALLAVLDEFALQNACGALQNACPPQLVALLGLMARLQGDALQNAIAREIRANMLAGYALLGIPVPRPKKPAPPRG